MAEEDSLVSRRPKRSTAGNRMELALAELAIEEPQEPEEDIEFVVDKDEEDVFESDFASTDEEAAQEGIEEGDVVVHEEEKRERRIARARVEKATAAAHARQRVTFNSGTTTDSQQKPRTKKVKRKVSLGVAMNAETGQVIEGTGAKRKSQRRHTIMNTSATDNRIKDAQEKRAAIPKKTKTTTRLPTQDELIAKALDTEEGNTMEHRNYLRLEKEKRAKARVVKQSIEGPVLRWISRKETIQVEVQLPSPPPPPPTTAATSANLYAGKYSFVYTSGVGAGSVGTQAYSMPFYAYAPFTSSMGSRPQVTASANGSTLYSSGNPPVSSVGTSTTLPSLPLKATPAVASVPSTASWQQQPQPQLQAQPQAQPSSILLPYSPVSTAPLIAHRSEDTCKNYVIHELSQSIPSKPPWKDTMSAMFGDHVKWDEVKVFTGKGRPLARPVRICPITGQPAKYLDPRTNVPFANLAAYDVLTQVYGREYVWCSALGCYMDVGEMDRKDTVLGENTGAGSKRGVGSGTDGDGDGGPDGDCEGNELEERSWKRPRVRMIEG